MRTERLVTVRGAIVAIIAIAIWDAGNTYAQTLIYNQSSGNNLTLVEMTNGVNQQLNTGLGDHFFPSVSQDGRFVLVSAADPQAPNEASGDLFEYDRITGQRRKVIDNSTTTRPDGTIDFLTPMFSTRSTNNQLIAVTTQLGSVPGGGNPRTLTVHRASDGFQVGLAAIGNGNSLDFTQSEFLGLSWQPNGNAFAAPGYVDVVTNAGRPTLSTGIVLYGQTQLGYGRVGHVTTPQVIDGFATTSISQETHVFPAYSPSGRKLAFFSVTYPDPLLTSPATAALITVNANGSSPTSLVNFAPGLFPLGLSWTPDGNQLVFSMANQTFRDGMFLPAGESDTGFLRAIDSNGGVPFQIAGAPNGLFPSVVASFGSTDDCNGDGQISIQDANCTSAGNLTQFLASYGFFVGDLDGNREVGFADFLVLSNRFGLAGQYTDGDLNSDGIVGFADFLILSNNFGRAGATAAVPEASTSVLILGAICILPKVRRLRSETLSS